MLKNDLMCVKISLQALLYTMLETIVIQLLSFWFIACAFGCYFVLEDQNSSL